MAEELVEVARGLRDEVEALEFGPPVAFVYDPLDYAWEPHAAYLRRYGAGRREVVLLGMNPGPWGMGQTGVPFGAVPLVRDWLGIDGAVGKPAREHPRRPVEGFGSGRSEVSGRRLWGWARDRFGSPERFFARFFVHNYCPLLFLEESGRNLTPDKLPSAQRGPLLAACDRALARAVGALAPRWVVGVGRFAARRAEEALGELEVEIGCVLHPSPASPAANERWEEAMEDGLAELGIELP